MVSGRLVTTLDESAIADALRAVQEQFSDVAIGSYPQYSQRPWTVTITMDATDSTRLDACTAAVAEIIGDAIP